MLFNLIFQVPWTLKSPTRTHKSHWRCHFHPSEKQGGGKSAELQINMTKPGRGGGMGVGVGWVGNNYSSRLTCDPMDCNPPSSSVHWILQARTLEWVAFPFSRGSSWPRDWNFVSWDSYIGSSILYYWATWKAQCHLGQPFLNRKWF